MWLNPSFGRTVFVYSVVYGHHARSAARYKALFKSSKCALIFTPIRTHFESFRFPKFLNESSLYKQNRKNHYPFSSFRLLSLFSHVSGIHFHAPNSICSLALGYSRALVLPPLLVETFLGNPRLKGQRLRRRNLSRVSISICTWIISHLLMSKKESNLNDEPGR